MSYMTHQVEVRPLFLASPFTYPLFFCFTLHISFVRARFMLRLDRLGLTWTGAETASPAGADPSQGNTPRDLMFLVLSWSPIVCRNCHVCRNLQRLCECHVCRGVYISLEKYVYYIISNIAWIINSGC
jgi:hypothetical protein